MQTNPHLFMGGPFSPPIGSDPAELHPMLADNNKKKPYRYLKPHEDSIRYNTLFWALSQIAVMLGLACLVFSIVTTSIVLFWDDYVRSGYETTTFLTTTDKYSSDSWQITTQSWGDLSKPNPTVDTQFNHYFECWWNAQVGWSYCNNASVNDYKTCIQTKFGTQLATCANTSDPNFVSPSLNAYVRCVDNILLPDQQSLNGLKICLRTNPWPLYETPQPVYSWYFLGSYNWATFLILGFGMFSCFVFYASGLITTDEQRDEEEYKEHGWMARITTFICALLATLFLIYFLINAFRMQSSSAMGVNYPYPNSLATNTIMFPTALIVFAYFIIEALDMFYPGDDKAKIGNRLRDFGKYAYSKVYAPQSRAEASATIAYVNAQGQQMMPPELAAHYRPPHMTPPANIRPGGMNMKPEAWIPVTYYPVLTLVWADAYMLDVVMVMGIIGATQQVSTAIAYQLFITVFAYRFINTALARFMYEGYIYNPDEGMHKLNYNNNIPHVPGFSGTANDKDRIHDSVYSVRMQALFLQIASLICVIFVWVTLSNTNIMLSEYSLVMVMLYTWFVVPEFIRIIAHFVVAFDSVSATFKSVLINTNYVVWIWDVILRIIFVCLALWGSHTFTGTEYFLTDRLRNMTDTISYMSM